MEKSTWMKGAFALFVITGLIIFAFVIFQAGAAYGGANILTPSSAQNGMNPFGVILFIGIGLIMLIFLSKMVFRLFSFPYPGWGMRRKHMHGWKHMRWNSDMPPQIFTDWHDVAHEGGNSVEPEEPNS